MSELLQTPIINEKLFKLHSPITANVDIEEFLPYIYIVQELHIEPVLGEPLMTELKYQIDNDELTAENSALIVKAAPALSFYAVYQALPFHWASIVNKGVTIRESENSKGIDVKDIAQLRSWIKNDADLLRDQLIDFMCRNKSDYPLWRPADIGCCNAKQGEGSTDKTFNSGFYFPQKNRNCGCK